jgi:hypothetical protein
MGDVSAAHPPLAGETALCFQKAAHIRFTPGCIIGAQPLLHWAVRYLVQEEVEIDVKDLHAAPECIANRKHVHITDGKDVPPLLDPSFGLSSSPFSGVIVEDGALVSRLPMYRQLRYLVMGYLGLTAGQGRLTSSSARSF